MIARHVLNQSRVYSDEEKAEFLESAKRAAKELGTMKLSTEAKALLEEQDRRHGALP